MRGVLLQNYGNWIQCSTEKKEHRLSYYKSSSAARIMNFLLCLVFMGQWCSLLAKKEREIVYPPNLVSLEEEQQGSSGDFSRNEPSSKCVSQSLLFTLSDKTVVPPFCFRGHGSSEAFTTTSLALDSKWGFAKVIWCKELLSFLIWKKGQKREQKNIPFQKKFCLLSTLQTIWPFLVCQWQWSQFLWFQSVI